MRRNVSKRVESLPSSRTALSWMQDSGEVRGVGGGAEIISGDGRRHMLHSGGRDCPPMQQSEHVGAEIMSVRARGIIHIIIRGL